MKNIPIGKENIQGRRASGSYLEVASKVWQKDARVVEIEEVPNSGRSLDSSMEDSEGFEDLEYDSEHVSVNQDEGIKNDSPEDIVVAGEVQVPGPGSPENLSERSDSTSRNNDEINLPTCMGKVIGEDRVGAVAEVERCFRERETHAPSETSDLAADGPNATLLDVVSGLGNGPLGCEEGVILGKSMEFKEMGVDDSVNGLSFMDPLSVAQETIKSTGPSLPQNLSKSGDRCQMTREKLGKGSGDLTINRVAQGNIFGPFSLKMKDRLWPGNKKVSARSIRGNGTAEGRSKTVVSRDSGSNSVSFGTDLEVQNVMEVGGLLGYKMQGQKSRIRSLVNGEEMSKVGQ
ncbi:hypothetical protein QVD17_17353 [Tagetes erecta]|uniref:Uncharacterized protein n=1 Tax=Tagetes erecta TaxID=13708 RepID=A0AAD8KT22_TARER|nr:hypothetical protein QVD17_17353 [Tagetes erecta]